MRQSPEGLQPAGDFEQRLQDVHGLCLQELLPSAADVQFEFENLSPPMDSALADPGTWRSLAGVLRQRAAHSDALVLLHGTDTMAYTGSALSFWLRDLAIPVVITGSMQPLEAPTSDALPNLELALKVATQCSRSAVLLAFGGKVLVACRSSKVSAQAVAAFDSPNAAAWAASNWASKNRRSTSPRALELLADQQPVQHPSRPSLGVLHIHPGVDLVRWRAWLQAGGLPDGLLLRSYGAGNSPLVTPEWLALLEQLVQSGCVVVNLSACSQGRVDLLAYASASPLHAVGVLGGLDMTLECAFTKLDWVCSHWQRPDMRRQAYAELWCEEASPNSKADISCVSGSVNSHLGE